MKTLLVLLGIFCLSFIVKNDTDVIDRIGVKGPLTFNNENYHLVWSDLVNEHYYIQEYLPKNEKIDNFNQMVTLHVFDSDIKCEDAVSLKVQEMELRKKNDLLCNYALIKNEDENEFMLDFIVSQSEDSIVKIAEFNIYHFKQVKINKKKKALLIFAYSKRSYGNKIGDFLRKLKEDRLFYLKQMNSKSFPTLNIKK